MPRERGWLDRWALALVVTLAVAARAVAMVATPLALFPDSRRFLECVKALRHHRARLFADLSDWTAPLPVLLWARLVARRAGVEHAIWLHHVLGCLTAALVFGAVHALHGAATALLVSGWFALSPYLLFTERAFLGETIHLWTIALALALFVGWRQSARPRRWAALLGIALGLGVLAKSNSELLTAGLALALLVPPVREAEPPRGTRVRVECVALAVGLCAAIVSPWLLYQKENHGVLQVTPNTERNRLLYAFEAGLFDESPERGPNPVLIRLLPEAASAEPFAGRGQATIGALTERYGFGAPSEKRAGRILAAEIRRKPGEFADLVGQTAEFLLIDRGRGHDELHDLLRSQWAGLPAPAGFPHSRGPADLPSPAVLRVLWQADAISFPIVRLAPAFALLGLIAAAVRGGSNRRWAIQLALPFFLVIALHSLALANNFRFLVPYLPLFALCAVSWVRVRNP